MDSAGGLENCLNFLKGNSDEQRLVGLLLATKYVKGDEKSSVIQIFDAVGIQFINRLLKSAFCRVPGLAASDEIIERIPTLLEVLKKRPKETVLTDCLKCLIGIASASDQGQFSLKKAGALPVLLDYLATFKSGLITYYYRTCH
ncbi:hypothetical protein L7F22_035074 [Adiantum nelumboides]|nr:hypothetical protein [Adiantum nelumboides]